MDHPVLKRKTITVGTPGAERVLVLKGGKPVGCVVKVDQESKRFWQLDLKNPGKLLEGTYDELRVGEV